MAQHIVTKEWMIRNLNPRNPKVGQVVGKALVALFLRQTNDERAQNETNTHNRVGFTGSDARAGCIAAKTFLKYQSFREDWMIERWLKPNAKGVPRLAKYWRQLDQIAREKQQPQTQTH